MRAYLQQFHVVAGFLAIGVLNTATSMAMAPEAISEQSADVPQLEEIVVTARKREENLQRVPDAVTAFTAATINNAGIQQLGDFAALTPNLTFQEGSAYRAGTFDLSMRGIGNGQEGSASVSYIVDGIPADSTDTMNAGSLEDIERIEVLRGPQSALYGFNAIAGAINVITKAPTNDWSYGARLSFGNGADRQVNGVVSGPLVADTILFRLAAAYRDANGVIRSASNGLDLDSKLHKQVRARLLFMPMDDLKIDFHANLINEHNGATYQDKVPSVAYIDDFSGVYNARRAFPGFDDRKLYNFGLRVQWDLGAVSLISVTSFSHLDQHLNSSFCYDDPNDPVLPVIGGGAQCFLGNAYGAAAAPGQASDEFFDSLDNFRTVTEDFRLASRNNGPVQWTVGASTFHRDAFDGFDAGAYIAPQQTPQTLFPAWNGKEDQWWGIYGQLSWNITQQWELTAAARYDNERYRNTTYTDRGKSSIVQVLSPTGTLIDTQEESATAFQPKGQIAYHFSGDSMGYISVSRGFRAGYFNTGTFTLPEHTTNYELGMKSMLWERRMMVNVAAFHIDYSDQQFSSIIAQYPFRNSITIPKTKINGAEFESTIAASKWVSFGLNLGYLDAKVSDGTRSPASPRFNGSASVDLLLPLFPAWRAHLHADDRYNTSQYLSTADTQLIPAKNYVNLRAGLETDHYKLTAFVRNATDRRQATLAGFPGGGGFIRFENEPRTYGMEVAASF